MKRLIQIGLLLVLLACAVPSHAACASTSYGNGVTCVQQVTNVAASGTTLTYTLNSVATTNVVMVTVTYCKTTCATTPNDITATIGDSGTSTCVASNHSPFTPLLANLNTRNYAWLCNRLSSGTHVWTITFSVSAQTPQGGASEWNWPGASTAVFDPANVDAAAAAASTNPTVATSATTTNPVDLVFAFVGDVSTTTPTVGAGFTEVSTNVNGVEVEAKTVAATGTQTAVWVSASQNWVAVVAPVAITAVCKRTLMGVGC